MNRNLFFALVIGSLSFTAVGATGCQGGGGVGSLGSNLAEGDACQKKGDCGAGLECEVEHGVGVCKKHAESEGGDDKGQHGGQDDGNKVDDGPDGGPGGDDGNHVEDDHKADGGQGEDDHKADGGQGEDDHKADGGQGEDNQPKPLPKGDCAVNSDCGPDEECELEHGVGTCKPHGGKK